MSVAWIIAAIVAGVWLLVALLQLGDVATVFLDSRTARDRELPGRIARERTNELFWVVPVGAIVALGIGLGIDQAGRYFFNRGNWEVGALFLLGLAVLVVGVGAVTLAATVAADPVSYSALRRELHEYEGSRITPKQLDDFHKRLSRIDRRARNRTRPSGSFFTTRTVLRLLAVVVGLILVVAVAVAESSHLEGFSAEQAESLLYLSILAPVLSALFATLAIRIAMASDAAWRRVYARQRIDIQKMLEEFDRTTRKRVPGLRKRVANALNILREQQP